MVNKEFNETLDDYIPKQKILDKIEEVESVLDMCKDQKVAKYKIFGIIHVDV